MLLLKKQDKATNKAFDQINMKISDCTNHLKVSGASEIRQEGHRGGSQCPIQRLCAHSQGERRASLKSSSCQTWLVENLPASNLPPSSLQRRVTSMWALPGELCLPQNCVRAMCSSAVVVVSQQTSPGASGCTWALANFFAAGKAIPRKLFLALGDSGEEWWGCCLCAQEARRVPPLQQQQQPGPSSNGILVHWAVSVAPPQQVLQPQLGQGGCGGGGRLLRGPGQGPSLVAAPRLLRQSLF